MLYSLMQYLLCQYSAGKLKPLESTHSGKRVKNRVENKIQEEMKKAEQRKSNNQIDATIQKVK